MKIKNPIIMTIYILLLVLLLFIIINFDEVINYINILTTTITFLILNYIIFSILFLIIFYLKLKIHTMDKKIVTKHEESLTDGMTKVYNRNGLNYYGTLKFKDAKNNKLSFACIFIDIDSFKKYNDNYGHAMGDVIIMEVANILKKSVRLETDLIIRYGGDEFLIILSNIKKPALHMLAKRIQKTIKNIKLNNFNDTVTLSIGIAYLNKLDNDITLNEIIKLSDSVLYSVKNKGGNLYEFS